MKLKWIFLDMIFVFGFFGCLAGTVYLRNEKGDTVKCEGREDAIRDCSNKYEGTGYKRYEEPLISPGSNEMTISKEGSRY